VTTSILLLAALAGGQLHQPPPATDALAQLWEQAKALRTVAESPLAHRWLDRVGQLHDPRVRKVHRNPESGKVLSDEDFQKLPPAAQGGWRAREFTPEYYYSSRYGSSLAYTRVLDFAAKHGIRDLAGRRVMDFGYGAVGHLRLMALMGADVVGVEVDPILPALYSRKGDAGRVGSGRLKLVHGQWPASPDVVRQVGGGYDLITSKNTLKRGYIRPEREAKPEHLVHLGVPELEFLRQVHRALKPGGLLVIYNLSPKPAPEDQPYIPWADGRSPFSREEYEAAGFEVLDFNLDDGPRGRAMFTALGYDGGDPKTLEENVFVLATVVRKRR
jgi:SAM-dependent methyltransferase